MARLGVGRRTRWQVNSKISSSKCSDLTRTTVWFQGRSRTCGTFDITQEILATEAGQVHDKGVVHLDLQLANKGLTKPQLWSASLQMEPIERFLRLRPNNRGLHVNRRPDSSSKLRRKEPAQRQPLTKQRFLKKPFPNDCIHDKLNLNKW